MLESGLTATINSDDPAYFGGYVLDNYAAARDALDLSADDLVTLARNSITASWANEAQKKRWLAEIDAMATRLSFPRD